MKAAFCYEFATLYDADIATLRPKQWLSSNAIDLQLAILEKATENSSICLVGPGASNLVCMMDDEREIREFAEPLNFGGKTVILIALNNNTEISLKNASNGTHWSLLVYKRGKGFFHFDSASPTNRIFAKNAAKKFSAAVGATKEEEKNGVEEQNCARQQNGYDCGVYVCCNIERIINEELGKPYPQITPQLVDEKRKMLYEFATQKKGETK